MNMRDANVGQYRNAGFTLIELMISMLLGLLIVGAALTIFLSNQQVQRTTQGVGAVQESLQIGFELLARDIRSVGVNPCDNTLPVANVVDGAATSWWTNWNQPLAGYDDGGLAGSAASTDALELLISDGSVRNVQTHTGTNITVDQATNYASGDVLMVCDMRQLAIFRNGAGPGTTVSHAQGSGNCSSSLGTIPAACSGSTPPYLYAANSQVTRMQGMRWLVADNGRGGSSLFRAVNDQAREEMVEGIADLQLRYLQQGGGYLVASAVTDWSRVTAIEVTLMAQDGQGAGVGGQPVQRFVTNVINLRGRTL